MIIWKPKLCLEEIEAFVNRWGWYVFVDLENGRQAAADHMGLFLRWAKNSAAEKEKITTIFLRNGMYVGNTKENLSLWHLSIWRPSIVQGKEEYKRNKKIGKKSSRKQWT